MVLTADSALSPATGLSCHRHPPDAATRLREFDASVGASGPHGYAVRVNALRLARRRVHRIPRPTSVTIAIRPSCGNGMAEDMEVIWPGCEAKCFRREDWTGPKSAGRASLGASTHKFRMADEGLLRYALRTRVRDHARPEKFQQRKSRAALADISSLSGQHVRLALIDADSHPIKASNISQTVSKVSQS